MAIRPLALVLVLASSCPALGQPDPPDTSENEHSPDWLGRPKGLAAIYYNVSLADCGQIIANVEWIFSGPNQVPGLRNRDVIVPGLRARIVF